MFNTNIPDIDTQLDQFMQPYTHNKRYFLLPWDNAFDQNIESQFSAAVNKILIQNLNYFFQAQFTNQTRKLTKIVFKCDQFQDCKFEICLKYFGTCYLSDNIEKESKIYEQEKFIVIIFGSNQEIHNSHFQKFFDTQDFSYSFNKISHIKSRFQLKKIDSQLAIKIRKRWPHPSYICLYQDEDIYQVTQNKLPDISQLILSSLRINFIIKHADFLVKAESVLKKLQNKKYVENREFFIDLCLSAFGNVAVNYIQDSDYSLHKEPKEFLNKILYCNFIQSPLILQNNKDFLKMGIKLFDDQIYQEVLEQYLPILIKFTQNLNDENIGQIVRLTNQKLQHQLQHFQNRQIYVNKEYQQFKNNPSFSKFQAEMERKQEDDIEKEIHDLFQQSCLQQPLTTQQILQKLMDESKNQTNIIEENNNKLTELYHKKIQICKEIDELELFLKQQDLQLKKKLQVINRFEHFREIYFSHIQNLALRAYNSHIHNNLLKNNNFSNPEIEQPEMIHLQYFNILNIEKIQDAADFMQQKLIQFREYKNFDNNEENENILEIQEQKKQEKYDKSKPIKKTKLLLTNKYQKQYKNATISPQQWEKIQNQRKAMDSLIYQKKMYKSSETSNGN